MILFQTEYTIEYNYIIHNFLKVKMFDGETDKGDIIETVIPKYLYREQYLKCVKVFEELFYWTEDTFYHQLTAFHELALYKLIIYIAEIQNEMDEFRDVYFDSKSRLLIEQASQMKYEEDEELSLEEHKEWFYDVGSYTDVLFEELDFLLIDSLYNNRRLGVPILEKHMDININFYFELLPLDIQKQYETSHITLTGEVSSLLKYIEDRMHHGDLYKLFWDNDTPVKEERIQLILDNIMHAYFYGQGVETTREALLGNGKVDFKLYKNNNEEEKVLVEIKRASSSYLKKGYEKQLTEYMLSSKYKNAFYLIACFTDTEYDKAMRFITKHVYTDTIQLYINLSILDLRKRKPASAL